MRPTPCCRLTDKAVPSDRPGGNTPLQLLPRLLGQGGADVTTPVLRTDPGAHHYVLKFLEIDGSANVGFETLVALRPAHGGHAGLRHRRRSRLPARPSVEGDEARDRAQLGPYRRAQQLHLGHQGGERRLAGHRRLQRRRPYRIINNFLEGAGENILFGGVDPAIANLVPSDIEVSRNHIYKPVAWRDLFCRPRPSPGASAGGAAALPPATHYFRVVAVMTTDNVRGCRCRPRRHR